jgi:opacity protein-like surface antigen
MRALLVTVLGLAAAAPVWAGATGIGYLGLRGSYVSSENQTATSADIDVDGKFDNGFGVSGFYGFVIDQSLRGEVEAGYRINDIETITVLRNDLMPASVGTVIPVDGQIDLGMAMMNLYYDFPVNGLPVLPWVGIGAGGAYVNYQVSYDYGDPLDVVTIKDSDWQFAYQLMAGVTMPIGEATSVSLGYRYFATEDMIYVATDGSEFETTLSHHSVDLGLQFHL